MSRSIYTRMPGSLTAIVFTNVIFFVRSLITRRRSGRRIQSPRYNGIAFVRRIRGVQLVFKFLIFTRSTERVIHNGGAELKQNLNRFVVGVLNVDRRLFNELGVMGISIHVRGDWGKYANFDGTSQTFAFENRTKKGFFRSLSNQFSPGRLARFVPSPGRVQTLSIPGTWIYRRRTRQTCIND